MICVYTLDLSPLMPQVSWRNGAAAIALQTMLSAFQTLGSSRRGYWAFQVFQAFPVVLLVRWGKSYSAVGGAMSERPPSPPSPRRASYKHSGVPTQAFRSGREGLHSAVDGAIINSSRRAGGGQTRLQSHPDSLLLC